MPLATASARSQLLATMMRAEQRLVSLEPTGSNSPVSMTRNRAAWRVLDRRSGEIEFFALEIADPCESRGFEYSIHLDKQSAETAGAARGTDIEVSDFVYPSWFWRLGRGPYHHNQTADSEFRIDAPFQIGKGANAAVFSREQGWSRRDAQGGRADLPDRRGAQLTLSDCPDWIGTDWIGT